MAYSIENLMAVVHASRAHKRPLAEKARDETLKALTNPDALPRTSELDKTLEIDPDSEDYRKWPADIVLQQQGPYKDQWRIVTWQEFEDIGTRTPEQAVDHAIGQIIEGYGKVRHAQEILRAAWLKNEWRRKVDKKPPQTEEEFEASMLVLLSQTASGVRGTYFEKMRQNAAGNGGSQGPSPQAPESAEGALA